MSDRSDPMDIGLSSTVRICRDRTELLREIRELAKDDVAWFAAREELQGRIAAELKEDRRRVAGDKRGE